MYLVGPNLTQSMKKVPAFNLQEMLIVLAIIGILLLIALPSLMPLIGKAKSVEAQIQLKALYHSQETYRFLHSRYSEEISALDFEVPLTVDQGGTANYRYAILQATPQGFIAQAEAVVDFDGDGVFNLWEIDQKGQPLQKVAD